MSKEHIIRIHSTLENEQAKVMYAVTKTLGELNLLSPDTDSIKIEILGREPIKPCRKSKNADGLDLSQLEWAEEKSQLWFDGPIKSLKIVLDGKNKQMPIRVQFV
jgi:hypothetical protein